MTSVSPIPFDDVVKKFGDCSIFEADEEMLVRCLAGTSIGAASPDQHKAEQMSDTIRHLIFMKQTEKIQKESSFVAKVALAVAVVAAFASVLQAIINGLELLCRNS